jgi:hypothetical protein
MEEKTLKAVKFRYIFPDEYNPVMATGVVGGPMPDGNVILNFYLERLGLPYSQTFEVSDSGQLGKEIAVEPEDCHQTFVRFVNGGVILSPDTALSIAKWLEEQVGKVRAKDKSK